MTCGTRVLWVSRRHKGSGTPYRKATRWFGVNHSAELIAMETTAKQRASLVVCDGRIVVTVRASDEPDWGDHHAELEILYKCETCGNTNFPHLPHDEKALSEAMTAYVGVL